VDPNFKDRILSLPRAKELSTWEIPQPSINEVRQKLGGPGISDDKLLLRFMVQEEEIRTMRSMGGPVKEYFTAKNPVIALIHELLALKDSNYIRIQKGDFTLTLQRNKG
jgi:oxaloacetate decarboxylase alpha subunit